ncbi:CarD family transcriptional regulator [Chloroflexota bacterium]
MMYSVGDKVVHPGYGPGVITGVERRQVIGEEKRYYVIDILTGGTTLMTPVAQAKNVGLRPALSDAEVKRLLRVLKKPPNALSFDFRERQNFIEERLKESDVFVTAEVMRDMTWYGQTRGLTKRDTQLLQRAEELVGGELALIWDVDVAEATDQVQAILAEVIRKKTET